ncbi:MAG: sigma factor-like helix-turn-helix DNA-binding protein [Planctomycetota bacterium]
MGYDHRVIERDPAELEELVSAARRASRGVQRGRRSFDDDVAQEMLLIALRDAHVARSWSVGELRTMAYRVASSMRRREAARRDRETIYARAAAPLVLQADGDDTGPSLREQVARLEPKSRSLIERRYFGGLSLSEIAALDGVPLPGVRTRHRRAIARLRDLVLESRARDHELTEPRRSWSFVAVVWSTLRDLARLRDPRLASVLITVVATASAVLLNGTARPLNESDALLASASRSSVLREAPPDEMAAPSARTPTTVVLERSSSPLTERAVEVVVRNADGQPLAGVPVLRLEDPAREERTLIGHTDRHGVLALRTPGGWYYAEDATRGTSMVNRLGPDDTLDLRLAARSLVVTGRLLGVDGQPVAAATVELIRPDTPRLTVDARGEWRRQPPDPRTVTDADGHFSIQVSALRAGGRLLIQSQGQRLGATIPPDGALGPVQLSELDSLDTCGPTLTLRDPDGTTLGARTVWIERPPFDVEDPAAAARGWSARHTTLGADASGRVMLPPGLEPSTLLRVGDGTHGTLRVAYTSDLATVLEHDGIVTVEARHAVADTARVRGKLPAGAEAYLVADALALPLELQADSFGHFDVPGLPAGAITLTGRTRTGAPLAPLQLRLAEGDSVGPLVLARHEPVELLVEAHIPDGGAGYVLRLTDPEGRIVRHTCADSDLGAQEYFDPRGFGRLLVRIPGTYLVTVENRVAVARATVEVDGNEPTLRVRLSPEPHEWAAFELEATPDVDPARIELRDAGGALLWSRLLRSANALRHVRVPLRAVQTPVEPPRAPWTLTMVDGAGGRWEQPFDPATAPTDGTAAQLSLTRSGS